MSCIEYKDYTETFKLVGKIGEGNCASVMRIQSKETGREYALKYSKFDSPSKLALAFQQIEVARAIDHPSVAQIYYYFVKTPPGQQFQCQKIEFGIVMELADCSLEQDIFMRRKKARFYTMSQVQQILSTLTELFAYAQQKGYMHRDIKPANILIFDENDGYDKKYKVCDFGFAIKDHEFADKNIAGTASYASPKIQNKFKNADQFVSGNNYKDDVYSLGITMLQVCTLESVEQVQPRRLLTKVNSRYGLKITALFQSMIDFQELKRPDFIQLRRQLVKFSSVANPQAINPLICSNFYDKSYELDTQLEPSPESYGLQNFCSNLNDQNCSFDKLVSTRENKPLKNQKIEDFNEGFVIKYTPKADKTGRKLEESHLQMTPPEDKVRTKRRSKMVANNHTANQATEQEVSSPQDLVIKLNLVLSFKGLKIRLLETFEISSNSDSSKSIIAFASGQSLYLCCYSLSKTQITEIRMENKFSSVQLLKYSQKRRQLIVTYKNGPIISMSFDQIIGIVSQKRSIVHINEVNYIEIQSIAATITAINIDEQTGNILIALVNGNIRQNGQLILQTKTPNITYLWKVQSFVFVGSFNGFVSKYKTKQMCINSPPTLLGSFKCQTSVIGTRFETNLVNGQKIIVIITSSGFCLRLNQNLELLSTKKISKECLRLSSLVNDQQLLSLDAKGNIINEKGRIVMVTKMQNIIELKITGKGKLIIMNEEGSIYEANIEPLELVA